LCSQFKFFQEQLIVQEAQDRCAFFVSEKDMQKTVHTTVHFFLGWGRSMYKILVGESL
jgi:hypothetical protein